MVHPCLFERCLDNSKRYLHMQWQIFICKEIHSEKNTPRLHIEAYLV